jgi:uncharacterized protein (DUF2252 family)
MAISDPDGIHDPLLSVPGQVTLRPPALVGGGRQPEPGAVAVAWPGPNHTGAQLTEIGKAARKTCPRTAHDTFVPASNRDPLAILAAQANTRVPELVPVRHARMAVSPFTFYRGAAAVMAADLATTPTTPLAVQLCGDAHLANFGLFGTPERHQAFDVNDFDETLPGPFEWDVKRLAASLVVAAIERGFTDDVARDAAVHAVRSYQSTLTELAAMDELDAWYVQLESDTIVASLPKASRKDAERAVAKARRRTSAQAMAKLTRPDGGLPRIVDDPPLITHLDEEVTRNHLAELFMAYAPTISSERRQLLRRYRVVDAARKVVGVGSVGTRCFILLALAWSDDSPLFIQVKEAQASVLEPFAGHAAQNHHGERVVDGQRLMQTTSDIFLGWGTVGEHHFYLRQLRDWKGSANLDVIAPEQLPRYGALCGAALARAHNRSGNADALTAYLGDNDSFAEAVADFAQHYASLNIEDHAAFCESIAEGRIEAAESP